MIAVPETFIFIGIAIIFGAAFSFAVHKRTRHRKPKIKGRKRREYYTVGEWVMVKAKEKYREKQSSLTPQSNHDPDKPDKGGNPPLPKRE
jgi:hypothetical protein